MDKLFPLLSVVPSQTLDNWQNLWTYPDFKPSDIRSKRLLFINSNQQAAYTNNTRWWDMVPSNIYHIKMILQTPWGLYHKTVYVLLC
jgi:hypothetical protein